MKRISLIGLLLFGSLLVFGQANAWWQSIQQISVDVGYQGPGNVVSGASIWLGLRCYNAAYVGNVARVRSPSDVLTTTITCSAGGVLGSTGTAIATTCAVSCTVDILYDQSGASSCSGACDATQTTEAARPLYILNCIGSLPCMLATASSMSTPTLGSTLSQPNWVSAVVNRTAAFTTTSSWLGDSGNGEAHAFNSSANTALLYAGTSITATAADSTFHAIQTVANGASSEIYVDGSNTTSNAGTGTLSGTIKIFTDGFGNSMAGDVTEIGVWNIAPSSGQKSSMNSNQHTYWGF